MLAQSRGPAAPALSLAAPTEYLSFIVGLGGLASSGNRKRCGKYMRGSPRWVLGWLHGVTPGRLPRICHMVFNLEVPGRLPGGLHGVAPWKLAGIIKICSGAI